MCRQSVGMLTGRIDSVWRIKIAYHKLSLRSFFYGNICQNSTLDLI